MEHPEFCYVFLATTNEVGIVKFGMTGYYPTNYPNNFTQEIVDELNERMGVSKTEAKAMVFASMAQGIETERDFEKHYNKVLKMLNERENQNKGE